MVQYGWILTHPYNYIYFLFAIGPFVLGAEFGLLTLLVTRERLQSFLGILGIAGVWVLLEWFRFFWLMGISFNLSGMALASTSYSLQAASLGGIYLLSFLVILTNLLFLRWIACGFSKQVLTLCLIAALFPYVFGFLHIQYHERVQETSNIPTLQALLVQTAFEVEEENGFQEMDLGEKVAVVLGEWAEIARLVKEGIHKKPDLIILPESVVPFASKSCLFPEENACALLEKAFSKKLEEKNIPFLKTYQMEEGPCTFACNGYFAKGIASLTKTPVLIGMEHIEEEKEGKKFYSSALLYTPSKQDSSYRYDKQILVPMAEYIPFHWLREAAKSYGISGSFTPGTSPKIFELKGVKCGVTICYEETHGSVVRHNKTQGAEVLINITNDGWYPHSNLPRQHLDLAILRTVELGVPLLRACNTGITCAVDSLGRTLKTLGKNESEQQTLRGTLFVTLPVYNYWTLYSKTGDGLIIAFSFLLALFLMIKLRWARSHRE